MILRAMFIGIACLASLAIAVAEPLRVEIDFSSPEVDNAFARANPDYKPRAASYYEREYLPSAADFLIEICEVDPALHPYLMEILRAFLYERVDAYVRGNGEISVAGLAEVVRRMETRLRDLLSDEQWSQYPEWKNDRSGKNGFDFLLVASPRTEGKAEVDHGDR